MLVHIVERHLPFQQTDNGIILFFREFPDCGIVSAAEKDMMTIVDTEHQIKQYPDYWKEGDCNQPGEFCPVVPIVKNDNYGHPDKEKT